MEKCKHRLAAGLALVASAVLAEAPAPSPPAEGPPPACCPIGAGAFESALTGYRPYRADEPLEDWWAANAAVGRAGGHAGHRPAAPETGQPAPAGEQGR